MIAGMEGGDGGADLVDHADAFMAQDAAGRAGGDIAFEDMQIGAADRRFDDPDDGVGRRGDLGYRTVFEGLLSGALDKRALSSLSP